MSVDLMARAAENRRRLVTAHEALHTALAPGEPDAASDGTPADDALAVLARLAPELGAAIALPPDLRQCADPLRALLRSSGLRTREVQLAPGWPSSTAAPMIAFAADGRPLALLPRGSGYQLFDPRSGRTATATPALAERVQERALVLYPQLPAVVRTVGRLLRFALTGADRDAAVVFAAGLSAAALVIPLAIGLVVPHLLASGGRGELPWLGCGVAVVTVAVALLLLTRNAAVVRLQGRLQAVLEPAVWDRLLALESRFFARYATGDLVQRANAISEARRSLSDVAVGALLGAFFSTSSLLIVLAIDWRLGLLLIAGVATLTTLLVALVRRQQQYETEVFRLHGRTYGLLYPLLLGIDKLQTAGREVQAFALWARLFGRQKVADAQTLRYQSAVTAVLAGAQPLLLTVLLAGVALLDPHTSVGHLIVAGVALGQVVLALGQVGQVATAAFAVAPILERLQPILSAPAEASADGRDPGRLRGALEFEDVTFTYPGSTGPAVERVSLRAAPGELIALVGPSGSGKSTIVRLLLGFESPATGTVRFDGRDLRELDVQLVRRQLGVVLQRSRLVRGSLLDNILASSPDADEADAWRAAELAGIAADIARLPLGMQTRVGEDNETFSGGQLQRLLIARALVRQPPIVVFDEATSALDNTTQREVSERIANLACTRIVIAHRLSTIRRADRIYVMDGGRVVAQGTYDELTERGGMFARLVERQEL
jgi:NHLM bacteriocin system ABC transporter ATP-binding protein